MEKCRKSCLDDSACVAFDFDNNCYHHLNEENLKDLNSPAQGVDHYQRKPDPNCATTPTGFFGSTSPSIQCTLLDTYEPVLLNTVHASFGTDPNVEQIETVFFSQSQGASVSCAEKKFLLQANV